MAPMKVRGTAGVSWAERVNVRDLPIMLSVENDLKAGIGRCDYQDAGRNSHKNQSVDSDPFGVSGDYDQSYIRAVYLSTSMSAFESA